MSKKPVLLCIMDGFGWTPDETYGNAVAAAKKPFIDSLMAKYPMTTIDASGLAVGLPDGQRGNSEVGHTNMCAGRIVYQQLTLITKSIRDGEMLKNPVLVKNMKAAIDAGKAIHLMGLVGTGGVHSHADHWFGVLEMAKQMGLTQSYSRTANCYDNATKECFNGTFKVEALYNPLLQLESPSFKDHIDFIGRFIVVYNKQRPCSVIGNLTPEQYRQAYYEKTIQDING